MTSARGSGGVPVRLAWAGLGTTLALSAAYVGLLVWLWPAGRDLYAFPGSALVTFAPGAVIGALVARRHPRNPVGWFFLAAGVCGVASHVASLYAIRARRLVPGSLPAGGLATWLASWLWLPALQLLVIGVVLLFPTGRPASPRWRPVARAAAGVVGTLDAVVVTSMLPLVVTGHTGPGGEFLADDQSPVSQASLGLVFVASAAFAALAVASLVVRLRGARGDERQQLRVVLFAVALAATATVLVGAIASLVAGVNGDAPPAGQVALSVSVGLLPVAAGVAVLRHGLWEIDVVINRTLLVGAMAAFVTAVYVTVAVGIGSLVGRGGNAGLALSLTATAMVAVAFQPVRTRVQHAANRLVYGQRATPYEVLAEFGRRVSDAYREGDPLRRMAQVLAEGLVARQAIVWLRAGDQLRPAAIWPPQSGAPAAVGVPVPWTPEPFAPAVAVAVVHEGELLGALGVTRRPDEPLRATDARLLRDLAVPAGGVLRNVSLTEELRRSVAEVRASRQRLVSAGDAVRRRLERDIHDGAQQHLIALSAKLGVAELLLDADRDRLQRLLDELRQDADEALTALHDLARGVYPPLLADRGLAAALQAQVRKAPLPVTLFSDGVGRYDEQIEAAVYFSCLEALQNAAKHASAGHVDVLLEQRDGRLAFAVCDDGCGFELAGPRAGSGLQNISDRLEALGGGLDVTTAPSRGTRVAGWLPAAGGAR